MGVSAYGVSHIYFKVIYPSQFTDSSVQTPREIYYKIMHVLRNKKFKVLFQVHLHEKYCKSRPDSQTCNSYLSQTQLSSLSSASSSCFFFFIFFFPFVSLYLLPNTEFEVITMERNSKLLTHIFSVCIEIDPMF